MGLSHTAELITSLIQTISASALQDARYVNSVDMRDDGVRIAVVCGPSGKDAE